MKRFKFFLNTISIWILFDVLSLVQIKVISVGITYSQTVPISFQFCALTAILKPLKMQNKTI